VQFSSLINAWDSTVFGNDLKPVCLGLISDQPAILMNTIKTTYE